MSRRIVTWERVTVAVAALAGGVVGGLVGAFPDITWARFWADAPYGAALLGLGMFLFLNWLSGLGEASRSIDRWVAEDVMRDVDGLDGVDRALDRGVS